MPHARSKRHVPLALGLSAVLCRFRPELCRPAADSRNVGRQLCLYQQCIGTAKILFHSLPTSLVPCCAANFVLRCRLRSSAISSCNRFLALLLRQIEVAYASCTMTAAAQGLLRHVAQRTCAWRRASSHALAAASPDQASTSPRCTSAVQARCSSSNAAPGGGYANVIDAESGKTLIQG